jgi:mRNA interferase MazF
MSEIIKKFLDWIRVKERLDKDLHKPPLFKDGEVWWVSFGENVGIEINGKSKDFTRPALVLKRLSGEGFMAIPMTTNIKKGSWYVQVTLSGKTSNLILSQARVVSSKRLNSKLGELDQEDYLKTVGAFLDLYKPKKFPPSKDGVAG